MGDAGLFVVQVARRFAKNKQDVWFVELFMLLLLRQLLSSWLLQRYRSLINELAAVPPLQPVVNMSQGFL